MCSAYGSIFRSGNIVASSNKYYHIMCSFNESAKQLHFLIQSMRDSYVYLLWDMRLPYLQYHESVLCSVGNGSGLPGCGPGLEPDRMVQFELLPGWQGYPAGSGTGWNRTVVPYYCSCSFASNYVCEFWSYRDMIST